MTVFKEKSVSIKPANEGKRMTKKLEAEKMEEAEKSDFPPLLLDSFKTKAVLAKVFISKFVFWMLYSNVFTYIE